MLIYLSKKQKNNGFPIKARMSFKIHINCRIVCYFALTSMETVGWLVGWYSGKLAENKFSCKIFALAKQGDPEAKLGSPIGI